LVNVKRRFTEMVPRGISSRAGLFPAADAVKHEHRDDGADGPVEELQEDGLHVLAVGEVPRESRAP
jgi:hypothetical protein